MKKYLLVIPTLIIIFLTVFLPSLITLNYSFKNYNLTKPTEIKYIFFNNYINIFKDKEFLIALVNTLCIIIIVTFIGIILSIIFSLTLNKTNFFSPFLTAIIIIPLALPPLINGIMWKFIFFPNGLINKLLFNFNIIKEPILFTQNRLSFIIIISLIIIWKTIPFSSILILSNLQNIPKEYYDAIYIDGANKYQTFFKITLPLIKPSIIVSLMNLTTASISVFDEIIALNGYSYETQTLLVYNYSYTFNFLDFGYGSAISYIIMFFTSIIGYLYIKKGSYL